MINYTSEKTVKLAGNMTSGTASNFVYDISNFKSDIYISTLDRNINAKSLLGVLSLSLRSTDIIRIQIISKVSTEQANSDLKSVINILHERIGIYE